ncbi:GntR family transcriptional regulator [Scopulibacillus cellulosilyticus]|uniref:GntR family transcriptional regulator n=1 Tax=Scopulibacillus cellulosilyticus TaxID=2665665 RepID=A0ABW2Q352_9BACL
MEDHIPNYIRLMERIKQKIEDGDYNTGDKIPSEREIAANYGINRMAVKNAVGKLAKEGYLKSIQGKGTFVVKTMKRNLETLTGLSVSIKDNGLVPSSKVITKGIVEGFTEMNEKLGLGKEDKLYRLLHLRLANGLPIALEDTYIPFDLFPDIEQQNFEIVSLFEYMENRGFTITDSPQYLTIEKLNERESKYLEVKPNKSVLVFIYIHKDVNGRTVEYTKSYTLGENTKFEVRLI